MVAHEQWWDEVGQYLFSTYLTKGQSKTIWRAALEFALEQEDWIGPDEGGNFGIESYIIREELEDK